jgi:hypothetical protein
MTWFYFDAYIHNAKMRSYMEEGREGLLIYGIFTENYLIGPTSETSTFQAQMFPINLHQSRMFAWHDYG